MDCSAITAACNTFTQPSDLLPAHPNDLGHLQDDLRRNPNIVVRDVEVNRRVVFYNGLTDSYILTVEGLCSMDLNDTGTAFNVICKTGPREYKRHSLVLSDNTTAFVEQLSDATVSAYHYRVTFKPQSILPDIDFRGDMDQLTTNSSEVMQ